MEADLSIARGELGGAADASEAALHLMDGGADEAARLRLEGYLDALKPDRR